jgi:CotS family spore coat protein
MKREIPKRQGGTLVNDIRIESWDHHLQTESHDVPCDQAVPPEVETVARHVLAYYDMQVDMINLISAKPAKGAMVWKLATNHGPRCMKLLQNTPNRSLFGIYAQKYLANQGASIPSLIPTIEGEKYVLAGGRLWIVTEWIESLQPATESNLEEAQALSEALGEFHRLSKGFNPPPDCTPSSVLGSWPAYYEKSIEDIGKCRQLVDLHPELESGKRLLSHLDRMEEQARDTLKLIKQSPYDAMVVMGEQFWGLVFHNDEWSKSDAQAGRADVWMTNLSNVSYDFPIRDLRRLISHAMVERGGWDAAWIRGMIEAYHRTNPLDRETFELLLLDLSFPNECYCDIKDILFGWIPFHQLELEAMLDKAMTMEASKEEVLSVLKQDLALYPNGEWNIKTERSGEALIIEPLLDEEEMIWRQFIQLELNKIQPEDPDDEPWSVRIPDRPPNASEEYASVEEETPAGSQTVPNTESLTDEEEIRWRKFIQHELNKTQHRDVDKSPDRAIAPELVQFVFRHVSSYLLARLRKAIEPSKSETLSDWKHEKGVIPLPYMSNRSKKTSATGKYLKRRRRRKEEAKKSVKRRLKPIVRRLVRGLKKSAMKSSIKKIIVRGKSNRTRQKSFSA